jgi:hypothetical protein
MIGTTLNVATILTGSAIGVSVGARLSERIQETVMHALGMLVLLIGVQMAMESKNFLIVMGAILVGCIVGEILRLENGLNRAGDFLQSRMAKSGNPRFSEGFVTATLVFCIGPLAILGSIQDGLTGDIEILTVKSMLDGFASIAFAAALGWGVAFSALSILLYQGGITLFAGTLESVLNDAMIGELTATGGIIVMGIGLRLLELKQVRLANFLPALAFAPLIVWIVSLVKTGV